jgi:hypothetical protein
MAEHERTRVGREEWAKRVARWSESGLTAAEFSTELGINPRTLTYWKWTLGKEARSNQVAAVGREKAAPPVAAKRRRVVESSGLIELQVAASDGRLELELRGGCRVRVPRGFDEQDLRRLLDLLEAR